MSAGYSGTPLPKKLGIREGSRVALLNAPDNFARVLGALPHGVTLRTKATGEADVIVVFSTKLAKLEHDFAKAMQLMPPKSGMLWVAWPKKAAKMDTDLDENVIRGHGLSLGVVDTKVCAIDETWSGLRFSRRKA
jgi:hypothetical protein